MKTDRDFFDWLRNFFYGDSALTLGVVALFAGILYVVWSVASRNPSLR